MKKEDTGKFQAEEKGTDGEEKNIFESLYDPIQKRISYKADFRDHCTEELAFIAGVLNLLYLVDNADQWNERSEEIAFVILDAQHRAAALMHVV